MKITSGSVQKDRKGRSSVNRSASIAAANSASAMPDGVASQGVDRSRLDEMIAVAAYFRAEQRGFAPGDELGDWFQAEAEYLDHAESIGKAS
ncbi:MAG: DUF2934 domain-containing protein [Sulfuritalea sp.]|nr:DUF2934 domain-containing protein [Sulfuritalea sp.]MDP1983591.1 DUF2934 domain-containing protein [Sulfuritalea sp.]